MSGLNQSKVVTAPEFAPAEPQAAERGTSENEINGADDDGEAAEPAPRRQPRRRPVAEPVAAEADETSAPVPVVEDVEPS